MIRYELPESERTCPNDGTALVQIGVEVSEQLDIVPQQVRVIRHERVKYACSQCDQGIKVTPARLRIIPKGLFTEAALAWFVVSKFMDGLPLYRIAALLRRFGGDISRNTLAASVVRLGEAVQPIINLLRDHLLDSEIVFGDETTVQVLKEPGRAAQTKSYMWCQMNGNGPPVRLFGYAPGRGTQHGLNLWAGMRRGAVLMSDGYEPYNAIAKTHGAVHLGCWVQYPEYRFMLRIERSTLCAWALGATATPHKSRLSQRIQKREEVGFRLPRSRVRRLDPSMPPERFQRIALHLKVCLDVASSCRDARMTKIVAYYFHAVTGLQQSDGATVAAMSPTT